MRTMGNKIVGDQLIIPAFRLRNFEAVYRLTRRITSAAPQLDFEELTNPDDRMHAVDVGPSEALVLAEVVCARERMALSSSMELPGLSGSIKRLSLLYAPFHPEHYFYVDSILGAVTFEKSLIQ